MWSKNQLTGEVSLKPVTNVFVHQVNSLLNLWVKGQKLTTTKNHIFYVAGKGWIEAGQILSKDKVMVKDGSLEEVTGTEDVALTESVNVYNFEVADWHTYFVGQGILVHNESIKPCDKAIGKLFGGVSKGPLFSIDPAMKAADEVAGVLVNGKYIKNPTAKRLTDLITDSGKIGSSEMSGTYMYVVDTEGNIIIGTRAGKRMPHPTLIGGENPQVQAAGIVEIRANKIYSVNNSSGHYKPSVDSLEVAKREFSKLPSDVFNKNFQGYILWDN